MEQEFTVEEVLDVRKGTKSTKGRRWANWEYLVKWKDYSDTYNSWRSSKLMGNYGELIRKFEEKRRADQYLAGQLKWTSDDVITGVTRVDAVRHGESHSSLHHLLVTTEAGRQRRLTLSDSVISTIAALTSGLCDADAPSDSASAVLTSPPAGKCEKMRKKHQKAATRKRDGRRLSGRRPKTQE